MMLWCFAHDKDARGFGVGKLILLKDIHIGQASRVWATIVLFSNPPLPPSLADTVPHLLPFAVGWTSHHLLLTEIPWGTGYLLSACELSLLLARSIQEL